MMQVIRSSRFRHVFGTVRRKSGYDSLKPTTSRDADLIKVSSQHVAIQWETPGYGALLVLPSRDVDMPGANLSSRINRPNLLEAHKSAIVSFDFSPFQESILATTDGHVIKFWSIPPQGLAEDTLSSPSLIVETDRLTNHRLVHLEFHPTSANLMITLGKDATIRLFDIDHTTTDAVFSYATEHGAIVTNVSWDWYGTLLATACKDRTLRIVDPRQHQIASTASNVHESAKAFNAAWLGMRDQVLTAGFSKVGHRQMTLWDLRQIQTPLHTLNVDTNPGMIRLHYDPSTDLVFTLGRGDSSIRYYEIGQDEPYIHYMNHFTSADTQNDVAPYPRRIMDSSSCEIVRFARLIKDRVDNVMFQVPRKNQGESIFHADLYSLVPSATPSTSANEWLSGKSEPPKIMSIEELMPEGFQSIFQVQPDKLQAEERRQWDRVLNTSHQGLFEESPIMPHGELDLAIKKRRASALLSKRPLSPLLHDTNQPIEDPKSDVVRRKQLFAEQAYIYDGEWVRNQKHGQGSLTLLSDNSIYQGDWHRDDRHGPGMLSISGNQEKLKATSRKSVRRSSLPETSTHLDKDKEPVISSAIVHATWANDLALFDQSMTIQFDEMLLESPIWADQEPGHGLIRGKLTLGKQVYEGEFLNGKRHGQGIWINLDKGECYEGGFKDDMRYGQGKFGRADGSVYVGSWKRDLQHGSGCYTDPVTKSVHHGIWKRGKLVSLVQS